MHLSIGAPGNLSAQYGRVSHLNLQSALPGHLSGIQSRLPKKTDGISSYRRQKSLSISCVNHTLIPTYWRGNISMVPTTLMQRQWFHQAVGLLHIQRVLRAGCGIFGAGRDSTLDHFWYTTGATISSVETRK